MRLGSRFTSSSAPQTIVGSWLRASLLHQRDVYVRLGSKRNYGKEGWNEDEPAVIKAASDQIIRKFFGPEYTVAEVAALVSDMCTRINLRRVSFSQSEMERVIRVALGEEDILISGIKSSELTHIRVAVTAELSDKLALSSSDVDELVAKAERTAFEQGWTPALAAGRRRAGPADRWRPERPAQIRTIVGHFLWATFVRQVETSSQLARQLNRGQVGWSYDEPAVVQAACELAVRRFFGPHYSDREVQSALSFMRAATDAKGQVVPDRQPAVEAVIRSALGETDVDLSSLPPSEIAKIQGVVATAIVVNLALAESEIVQLIAEAERIAFERGRNPPLAD